MHKGSLVFFKAFFIGPADYMTSKTFFFRACQLWTSFFLWLANFQKKVEWVQNISYDYLDWIYGVEISKDYV